MRRLVPGGTFDLYIRVKDKYYGVLMQTGLLYIRPARHGRLVGQCTVDTDFDGGHG
jgi:hypothetical protein